MLKSEMTRRRSRFTLGHMDFIKMILNGYGKIANARAMAMPFPSSVNGSANDAKSVRSDWDAIGNDIRVSIERYATRN